MSNAPKHTPAPWQRDDTSIYIYSDKYEHDLATLYFKHDEPYSLEEFEANARLITAAPDMLREMESLAQALEDTGHEPPQSFYDAIKKARGLK